MEIISKIINIYDKEIRDDLDHEAKDLVKRFNKVIDQHSQNYGLETQNDVNPIKYYSFKYRIKKAESLKEKLVKKNLGLRLIQILEVSDPNEIENKKPAVISQLKKIPDVIGVRIVTELRHDCGKVLDLIRAFFEDLAYAEIVLDTTELQNQPQKMKNGLSIIKIKGIFRRDFGFELQIKSKIEEAWGDMDHAIFYKDYSVTPIKNITNVTMNNVGKLLENIDELLLGLRSSDLQYQENLEQISNLKSLNDELYQLIKNKLGISFEIGKVASFLNCVKEKAIEGIDFPKSIEELDCSFLDFTVNDPTLISYTAIREKSFELMIIEAAYFNWCKVNGKITLTQENYEQALGVFLEILIRHIFNVIEKENSAVAAELDNAESLSLKLSRYSAYLPIHELYLSEKTIINIVRIEASIEEFFQDKEELSYDGADRSNFIMNFKILYVANTIGYDDKKIISDLLASYNELNYEQSLDSLAYDFKEYQTNNEMRARADQKKGDIVKESIPSISVCESIITKLESSLKAI